MTGADGTAEGNRRTAELRRAVVAGRYAPRADQIAEAILAKVDTIRRARRRMEVLEGPRLEPELRPPRRRFRPRSKTARSAR
jgi:hypothetical protein